MENRRIWTRRSVLLLVVLVALVACVFVGLVVPSGAQTIIPRPAAAVVQELTLTRPDEVITEPKPQTHWFAASSYPRSSR